MSATVLPREHIDILVKAGLCVPAERGPVSWYTSEVGRLRSMEELLTRRRELRHANRNEIGLMLHTENVRSVRFLYRAGAVEEFPPPVSYEYRDPDYRPTPTETMKALECYAHQSNEHPGWGDSEALRFCGALRQTMIGLLPGYDEAPWSWTAEDVHRKRADFWRSPDRR